MARGAGTAPTADRLQIIDTVLTHQAHQGTSGRTFYHHFPASGIHHEQSWHMARHSLCASSDVLASFAVQAGAPTPGPGREGLEFHQAGRTMILNRQHFG